MQSLLDFISSIPNSPQGVLEFVASLLVAHGYLVIIFGAALDNFGLPASGDVVLFAGGLFANGGQLALPLVMLSGFVGGFMIYRILKMRFLHFLINEKSLDRVERYFEAHGGKTVFVGRFGPGLRSMTPLFAGVSRMRYYRFLPYNLPAAVVWAVTYSLVGYVFGQYWDELLAVARSIGYGVIAIVTLLLLAYVLRRFWARNEQH